MDDYLIVAPLKHERFCLLMDTIIRLCAKLVVLSASEKTLGPSTKLTFLGIDLDSSLQVLSLAEGKRNEILCMLSECSSRRLCIQTELQSLLGSLRFAA